VKVLLRFVYPVVLAVAACWLISSFQDHPRRGVDDAQILFSYSSNLATGRGLTYANNPERVEGATSLLWTFICAIPFGLGFDESGVLAISVLLLCLTQVLILGLIRQSAAARDVPSWPFELAYLLVVFSSPTYLTWMSITLMDTCLWGFLVALMVYVAFSPPPRSMTGTVVASLPFFLALLSRPEAAIVAPAIVVLAWLRGGDQREGRRRLVVSSTTAFLVSAVAVTAFRLSYFGYPLPNTFYAKVSPSLAYNLTKGGEYLLGFVLTSGPVVVATAFFLLWCAGDSVGRFLRRLRTGSAHRSPIGVAAWRLAALGAMVLLGIPVLTGGDHFVGYRFYQPAFPVMALTVVLFLASRLPTGILDRLASPGLLKPRLAPVLLLLGLAYWAYSGAHRPSWLDVQVSQLKPLQDQIHAAEEGIQQGSRLRELFSGLSDYPAIGVTAAGGIARTYPGRIVDLMGLNSLVIAHHPGARRGFRGHTAFEKEAFFGLPGIDVLDAAPPVPPRTVSFATFALKGLLDDPRFVAGWRYGVVSLPGEEAGGFKAFYSVRLIESLEATGRYRFRETMRWSNRWVLVDSTDGM
jgi:arabinofuranosyltransferase